MTKEVISMRILIIEDFCNEIGHDINFVQDNISKSKKNVVRGLHFQISPMAPELN